MTPPRLAASFPSARTGCRSAIASAVVALVVGACDCSGPGTVGAGPVISVNPTSLTIAGVPSRFTETRLEVSNLGNSPLVFTQDPTIIEADGDANVEFGVPPTGLLAETCAGEPRGPETKNTIGAGACAVLILRYRPAGDGQDTAVLRIHSNDSDTPELDVPINASAHTPDLEVCAFDGATELGCNIPGSEFEVDFGFAAPGTTVPRTLKLKSKGSAAVKIDGANLTGNADFTVSPSPYAATLESGQEATLDLAFGALAGGPREARLLIESNDPAEEKIGIRLIALGDGPKICLCVGAANEACRPAPTASFGRVAIGGTGSKYVRFASCGTKPVDLTALVLGDTTGVFGATVPALPLTLTTGDTVLPFIEVPITFKPTSADRFQARLSLTTTNEQGFVTLEGEGFESGCKLESASSTIDFGQVEALFESRRDYTVANRGTEDCVIPASPVISAGAAIAFGVVSAPTPPAVIAPGATAKLTVKYTPADTVGPDVGELSIPYRSDSLGAPVAELKVQLKGTPVAEAKCIIVAQPGGSSVFGRTLNYGQVRVRQPKILPVTLANQGGRPCNVSNVRVVGSTFPPGTPNDAAYFKIQGTPPTTIAPGTTASIEVAFTPDTDRAFGSPLPGFPGGGALGGVTLQVQTSDTVTFDGSACSGGGFPPSQGNPGCVAWSLTGTGAKSDLQVLPPDLNFGLITLGCRSREATVTLYNTGTVPINITELKVDPPQTPEIFKVISPPVPFTLAGGTQRQLTVRYRPPDVGIHTATIFIKSDATNVSGANPYVTVSLKGTGTTDSHQTDTFDQNTRPKTDVLFIIDDSGSMSEEQGALAGNASRFINVANQLNTDYQIGVITTDNTNKCGELRGNPKIILPGPNAATQFSATVRALGTNGSSDERGLETMICALTDPVINDPAKNAGFLRLDAKLAVVVVSDEEDGSRGTLDFYTDFLKNLKGIHNQSLVSLSAIVGDEPSGCSSNNGDATAGSRYLEVQRRTNGKARSICTSDWGQIAADLGLDAFGARAGFPLSRLADAPTIHVKVNGAVATGWTYDAVANAVVFNAATPPPPGATVVIDYEALCL